MAIIGVFGKPGTGKTTYLTSRVVVNDFKKKLCSYIPILEYIPFLKPYSVIYCNDSSIKGTVYYSPESLGLWKPAKNSLILMSEAGVHWNNRNTFKQSFAVQRLWAEHRHMKCDIIWESQTVDVDIKLRQRTSHIWLLTRSLLPHKSILQRVSFRLDVNDDQHVIAEMYDVPRGFVGKVFSRLTGGRQTLNRKKYYAHFDSWSDDGFKYSLPDPAEIKI